MIIKLHKKSNQFEKHLVSDDSRKALEDASAYTSEQDTASKISIQLLRLSEPCEKLLTSDDSRGALRDAATII